MVDCMTCGGGVCLCPIPKPSKGGIIQNHLDNWVYSQAREITEQMRIEQILKGAEKYPVPLGDADWTPLQLITHALQENIDQNHYLVMLKYEIERLNSVVDRQQKEIVRLERLLNPVDGEN